MKTVRFKTWREHARPQESDQLHPAYRKYFYYARRRYFNKPSLMMALTAVSFWCGLSARIGNVIGVSLVLFLVYLYLRARSLAESIRLGRVAPLKAVELETIDVGFVIENRGGFQLSDLVLIDHFTGAADGKTALWLDEGLAPHSNLRGSYQKKCDAGMGVFEFGPMAVVVTDALGIFEFTVTEDQVHRIDVYPRIESLPELELDGSQDSFQYGIHDLPARGTSVNFVGIREYKRGDPLRHIAWRLSVRNQRLLVKEFEKIANTEITVLLGMDARDHMGRKAESTWEYAKDAALGIVAQQMVSGNSLQLVSDRVHVPFGRGEPHANLIARKIFSVLPELPADDADQRLLVERALELVPAGSTLVYIGPIYHTEPERLVRALNRLKLNHVEVCCVLVNPAGFIAGKVHGDLKIFVDSNGWKIEDVVRKLAFRLASQGMRTWVLDNGKSVAQAFLGGKGAA